jgi:phi13 family phage major tail protein
MATTSTKIGCDHLVYAILTADTNEELTYDAPVALPGVMSLNVNPNASMATIFYDDGPGESASTLGQIEVEINKNALSTAEKAALLGHGIDANGSLIYGANDTPPWVAIGFRTLKANGTYRYVWLLKGKFMEVEDNNETRNDSVNFQNDVITGQFAKTNKSFTIGGKIVYPWKTELDEEHTTANEITIGKWFDKVYLPSDVADE